MQNQTGKWRQIMASNNYAVLGPSFDLTRMFRVLRIEGSHPDPVDYNEVSEGGTPTNSTGFKGLIATASALRFVDFGNGLIGLFLQCGDCQVFVVDENDGPAMMNPNPGAHPEPLDPEEIF
jgi:hypothetical protein